MNIKRLLLLAFGTYGICAIWAITGVQGSSDTPKTLPTPSTVTVGMLTPQQQQERIEQISTTTTSTTTTTTVAPSATVVAVPADTHCQEWFPTAISVGWPNDPAILQKLGQLLWKETRCQNVNYLHPMFNGHDHGVAQINVIHRAYVEQLFSGSMEESMSDPTLNLRFAYLLYSEREAKGLCGWKPWSLC